MQYGQTQAKRGHFRFWIQDPLFSPQIVRKINLSSRDAPFGRFDFHELLNGQLNCKHWLHLSNSFSIGQKLHHIYTIFQAKTFTLSHFRGGTKEGNSYAIHVSPDGTKFLSCFHVCEKHSKIRIEPQTSILLDSRRVRPSSVGIKRLQNHL